MYSRLDALDDAGQEGPLFSIDRDRKVRDRGVTKGQGRGPVRHLLRLDDLLQN
jgi:hypothetical protein